MEKEMEKEKEKEMVKWTNNIGRQLIKEVRFTMTSDEGFIIAEDIFKQCDKCHNLKGIWGMSGDSFTCINCLFAQPDPIPTHSSRVNSVYHYSDSYPLYYSPDHHPPIYHPPDFYSIGYHPFYFVYPRLPVINPFPALITYVPQREGREGQKEEDK